MNLSPSPCLRRLRQLETAGGIRGYTALVDQEAYGLPVTAFVRIKLRMHNREVVTAFERAVQALDAVLDCYVLTGDRDYQLRVLARDLKSYEQFVRNDLHDLPGVESIDTSFAYGCVKSATTFPAVRA